MCNVLVPSKMSRWTIVNVYRYIICGIDEVKKTSFLAYIRTK